MLDRSATAGINPGSTPGRGTMIDYEPECGTTTGYNHGCRCEDCRYAMTVAKRNSRRRIAARRTSPLQKVRDARRHVGDWAEEGLCRSLPRHQRDWFFSTDIGEIAQARAICRQCPMRARCLEHALTVVEFGVWGGESERARRRMKRDRRTEMSA